MKKRPERRKHCAPAAVPHRRTEFAMAVARQSQNSPPPAAIVLFETQFGEDRCTQFRVIVVTDTTRPPATNTQTHRQNRLQYTAPLASAQCNQKTVSTNSMPATDYSMGKSCSAHKQNGKGTQWSANLRPWQNAGVQRSGS